ncbi:tensin-4 isoform X2 [Petaurus breviceps papuanus]|uniref:tensin-4 isoform X2 n=1 Tax=Petaurus breviceps papuanus TaxID=3040969 RepID=UPI0036D7D335
MSQVMSSQMLRAGHAVCIGPQEEARNRFLPAPSTNLAPQCPYYTTEGWGTQVLMAPMPGKGQPLPSKNSYALRDTPGAGQAVPTVTKLNRLPQPRVQQDTGWTDELASSIGFSLESLNQMILELDPNFELLPSGAESLRANPAPTPNVTVSRSKKEDPEVLEIKYIEVTSANSRCQEPPQCCASPSVIPSCGSPLSGGILLCRDTPRENSASRESLIFSGNQHRGHHHLHQQPPPPVEEQSSHHLPSPGISIPHPKNKNPGPQRDSFLLEASPGSGAVPRPSLGSWALQRGSGASLLSSSPGSDTSYAFGSSQSLLSTTTSSHQPAYKSPECPRGSSSSIHNPGTLSLSGRPSYFHLQSPDSGLTPPVSTVGQPVGSHSPPLQKEHASSCPPSIANSMVDIPIVLINGCPEPGLASPQPPRRHHSFVRPMVDAPSSPYVALRSHSKTPSDTSLISSSEGPSRDTPPPTMKFVMDKSKYWFKPSITRDQAIELLRMEEPGAFVIRDSTSYRGSFGLAMKVQESPTSLQSGSGADSSNLDLIRHFLIESSAKGVHLKGAGEEPYFGSLSAFVYQHSIMPLALPCKLIIPRKELGGGDGASDPPTDSEASRLKKSASCQALYLTSVSVETLTGAMAVQKAVSTTFERDTLPTPTVVHVKVTEQGITLTDVQRKVFFRRHYPLATLRFCGMDPEHRKWQKYCKSSQIFGFIAKSLTEPAENVCHLFAEYDTVQPVSLVIDLMGTLLLDTERI